MAFKYLLQDEKGNVGPSIPIIQGETRDVTLWLFELDGRPIQQLSATYTEIVVKVFSQINQASIVKKLSLSQVSTLVIGSAVVALKFTLSAADTGNMAANNSGLAMRAILTDSTGKISEFDLVEAFDVKVPVVLT